MRKSPAPCRIAGNIETGPVIEQLEQLGSRKRFRSRRPSGTAGTAKREKFRGGDDWCALAGERQERG